MPGQICTVPEAISSLPTYCMNWPSDITMPPFLCRNGGM